MSAPVERARANFRDLTDANGEIDLLRDNVEQLARERDDWKVRAEDRREQATRQEARLRSRWAVEEVRAEQAEAQVAELTRERDDLIDQRIDPQHHALVLHRAEQAEAKLTQLRGREKQLVEALEDQKRRWNRHSTRLTMAGVNASERDMDDAVNAIDDALREKP